MYIYIYVEDGVYIYRGNHCIGTYYPRYGYVCMYSVYVYIHSTYYCTGWLETLRPYIYPSGEDPSPIIAGP